MRLVPAVVAGFLWCAAGVHAAPREQGASQPAEGGTREMTVDIPQLPELAFRLDTPVGLSWRKDGHEMKGLEASGMVQDFARLMIGEDTRRPDRLRMTLYVANVVPTRAAVPMDYARLMAKGFGNGEGEEENVDDAEGNTVSANVTTVVTRDDKLDAAEPLHSLIGVWRRGMKILIVRADMSPQVSAELIPRMREMMRSMVFLHPMASDPLMDSMVTHTVRLPSGKDLTFKLPPNWRAEGAWDEDGFSSQMFKDGASHSATSRVLVFGIEGQTKYEMSPELLRGGADMVSDHMLKVLWPGNGYTHRSMQEAHRIEGTEKVSALDAMFVDKVTSSNPLERELAASTYEVALRGNANPVIGFSALAAPGTSDFDEIGSMMHVNFVQQLLVDSMREAARELGP